ncbi:hypothetical protein [Paenibacillus ferrarius]|uniref:hypothetical protein n=1 Tax=Paenibacillus ferrarius TaxID=1469647 RepID=UPI003D288A4A
MSKMYYVCLRGSYDGVDWGRFRDILIAKGYHEESVHSQGLFGGMAWCDLKGSVGCFRLEYDDWGSICFYPREPHNENLLDELHVLCDEFELIGSTETDYKKNNPSKIETLGPRRRLIESAVWNEAFAYKQNISTEE